MSFIILLWNQINLIWSIEISQSSASDGTSKFALAWFGQLQYVLLWFEGPFVPSVLVDCQ